MTNSKIIWILFGLTIFLMVTIRFQNTALITPSAPLGILSLEFSTTAAEVDQIRAEWTGGIRQAFYINTVLDYFYLFFYGLFLFFTCRYFAILTPGGEKIGSYAALAGITAAGLDAVENLLMMVSINFGGNTIVATSTAVIAAAKFVLAGFAVLYIIVSLVTGFFRRER